MKGLVVKDTMEAVQPTTGWVLESFLQKVEM